MSEITFRRLAAQYYYMKISDKIDITLKSYFEDTEEKLFNKTMWHDLIV